MAGNNSSTATSDDFFGEDDFVVTLDDTDDLRFHSSHSSINDLIFEADGLFTTDY